MGNRLITSILLFITAVISFIGFLLHVIFFWMPYDETFLINRVILINTALLCLLFGLLIILDTSPKEKNRFETRFLFLLVFIVLTILVLIAFLLFVIKWGASEYTDGLKMTELLEENEEIVLIVLFIISGLDFVLLLVIVILNALIISKNWGELEYDN